jgi:hypothetical protein
MTKPGSTASRTPPPNARGGSIFDRRRGISIHPAPTAAELEHPAACCEGGGVSLALCATSEGILGSETPAHVVIHAPAVTTKRRGDPAKRLAVSIGVSVMSDAAEKVPTGGELTLFEAVGPSLGLTSICCVARRRSGMVGVT